MTLNVSHKQWNYTLNQLVINNEDVQLGSKTIHDATRINKTCAKVWEANGQMNH